MSSDAPLDPVAMKATKRDGPPVGGGDLPLRCRCGHVRGVASDISPSAGFRLVCHCKDCQAFARFLERPDVLDPAGGTDIFQMPPGRIKLTAGMDALRCLRLSEQGVFRWYTDCCRTPIANTTAPRFPVIGVIHSFMDHEADGRPRDAVLGPPLCRLHEGSATGALPSKGPPPPSFGLFVRRVSKLVGWWARGLGWPSPFFYARKAPLAAPRVLTRSERAAI